MNLAAIDIGSNSCRLLIARISGGFFEYLLRDLDTTRIGEGVEHTGLLNEKAIFRTINCLRQFKEIMQSYQVMDCRVVATSAVREAGNRRNFIEAAQKQCGLQVEIISGEEEAALSYLGVKRGLGLATDPLVVDLGGGSTEIIWHGDEDLLLSLPIGAVRATEAAMSAGQIEAILTPIISWSEKTSPAPLVFVGGTATSLVAIKLALRVYDSKLVHGQKLSFEEVKGIYEQLVSLSQDELKALPGLQAKRADIISQGVLIALTIMDLLRRSEMIVSESDLLDAIIWQLYDHKI